MSDKLIEIIEKAGKKAGCDFELIYIFLSGYAPAELLDSFIDFCEKYIKTEG